MISKQFLITGMFMGVVAMVLSALFRMQLANPGSENPILKFLLGANYLTADGAMSPDAYLALVTIHGTIMVFFVLTGGLSGTFANLLIPFQVGARDMASGFLNMLSYWFFFVSSVIMIISLFVEGGAASAGWTIYPPLSALTDLGDAAPGQGAGMTMWLTAMALFIVSSLLAYRFLFYVIMLMQ